MCHDSLSSADLAAAWSISSLRSMSSAERQAKTRTEDQGLSPLESELLEKLPVVCAKLFAEFEVDDDDAYEA